MVRQEKEGRVSYIFYKKLSFFHGDATKMVPWGAPPSHSCQVMNTEGSDLAIDIFVVLTYLKSKSSYD